MTRLRTAIFALLLSLNFSAANSAEFVFGPLTLLDGEVDLFDFVVDTPGFVGISTFDLHPEANTILTLLDDTHGFIAQNDDAIGLESVLVRMLAPGQYTAAVSGFPNFFPFAPAGGPTATGEYSLVIFGAGVVSAAAAEAAVVPLPATLYLLLPALLAGCSWRRTRDTTS